MIVSEKRFNSSRFGLELPSFPSLRYRLINKCGCFTLSQGFGIAVVPYMDLLLKLNVRILKISSPAYERAFFMVHDKSVYLPPAVQNFRQYVLGRVEM